MFLVVPIVISVILQAMGTWPGVLEGAQVFEEVDPTYPAASVGVALQKHWVWP